LVSGYASTSVRDTTAISVRLPIRYPAMIDKGIVAVDQTPGSLELPRRRCNVCKEEILQGARVCNHCQSRQDWTRYLQRWGSLSAFAVGIIPLVAGSYSLYTTMRIETRFIPEVFPVKCSRTEVRLALVNAGGRSGMIYSATLKVSRNDTSSDPTPISLSMKSSDASDHQIPDSVLTPHSERIISYATEIHGVTNLGLPTRDQSKTCTLEILLDFIDASGVKKSVHGACPCPE
jgi:hypothetical protein